MINFDTNRGISVQEVGFSSVGRSCLFSPDFISANKYFRKWKRNCAQTSEPCFVLCKKGTRLIIRNQWFSLKLSGWNWFNSHDDQRICVWLGKLFVSTAGHETRLRCCYNPIGAPSPRCAPRQDYSHIWPRHFAEWKCNGFIEFSKHIDTDKFLRAYNGFLKWIDHLKMLKIQNLSTRRLVFWAKKKCNLNRILNWNYKGTKDFAATDEVFCK